MKKLLVPALILAAQPALASTKNVLSAEFYSLHNTDFIVLLAFLLFIGVLVYLKVPGQIGSMLDKRATTIRSELDEARALREEAQSLLASYERKQKDVAQQAARIVSTAKEEAERAAAQAREDIAASVARRLVAAEEQLTAAQNAAIKEVRDRAVTVAIAAAQEVITKQMTAADGNKLIDDAIATIDAKLH